MRAIGRCCRSALALWLAASLVGIGPTLAGPGDDPSPPLGGDQRVLAGPGDATQAAASSASAGSATGGAIAAIEERLLPGDTSSTFTVNGAAMSTRELLNVIESQPAILENLKRDLDEDIATARLPLAIDGNTRQQVGKLDEKYVPLQAALSVEGEHGRAPIAVYETTNGPAMALKGILDEPSREPVRYGFITRVSPKSTHWVAGDLYVDKAAGVVSLVTWDSVATFSLDMVTSSMGRELQRAGQLDERMSFVASHNRADLQSLSTGCSQCSLSFLDEMRERDLHSQQIGELRDALEHGAGRLPKSHQLNSSGSVDFLRIRVDQTARLPDRVIALTNAQTALVGKLDKEGNLVKVGTLTTRVEELLAERSSGAIDEAEFAREMGAVRDIMASVQGDRELRILDSDKSDIVGGRLVPRAGTEKLVNLKIDRLRVRDLRTIREQLNDEPFAFLGAARDLNRDVVLDGVAAGRRQRRLLEQDGARLPIDDADGEVDAASTADHQPAREAPSSEARSALDAEALLERAEAVDAPAAPNRMPAGSDVDVNDDHEASTSFRDQAKTLVDKLFAEVEAEAAERERREAEGGEPATAETDRETGEI